MKILYMSTVCPKSQYPYLTRGNIQEISIAAYNFHRLLIDGIAADSGVSVSCIIPNIIHQKLEPNLSAEDYRSDRYVYLKLCRGKLRHIKFMLENLKYIKGLSGRGERTVILCDALQKTSSLVCVIARRLYKVDAVAIVTDLPQYVGSPRRSLKQKLLDRFTLWCMNKFSAYVLLTEQMNRYVNKNNRPYCVVEGFCDAKRQDDFVGLEHKQNKKVCIYAGSIHKRYNIDGLVKAFDALDSDNCELRIYGNGRHRDEVAGLISKCRNVKYMGVVTNDEILKAEREATLLINPRPASDEYTKYSFPSKTLEYMASGTPVLTTKLPGMSREYYPHVYFIEEETVDGMCRVLQDLLDKPREELHAKGVAAREFVLNEKNNIVQARKIFGLLEFLS